MRGGCSLVPVCASSLFRRVLVTTQHTRETAEQSYESVTSPVSRGHRARTGPEGDARHQRAPTEPERCSGVVLVAAEISQYRNMTGRL